VFPFWNGAWAEPTSIYAKVMKKAGLRLGVGWAEACDGRGDDPAWAHADVAAANP
jgi:hypothetical protein